LVAAAACGGSSPPPAQTSKAAVPGEAPPPADPSGPVVVVSITPDTIDVQDGRAASGFIQVEYRIRNPEQVETAELRISVPNERGELHKEALPIQASGIVNVNFDAGGYDLGPKVQFRANCSSGSTDWVTLNAEALPDDAAAAAPRLTHATAVESDRGGIAARLSLFGQGLSADCSAEGQAGGRSIEVLNQHFEGRRIQGLLERRELNFRSVPPRYLEVQVRIRGPKLARADGKRLRFNE
jgi:hypothetical protein